MSTCQFDQVSLLSQLSGLDPAALDALDFGVIGFDGEGIVRQYNRCESRCTGLAPDWVIGQHVFTAIAQCMNNYLVAQRFEDAAHSAVPLDDTIDYVLTWRLRPTQVKLRMLSAPAESLRYVLLRWAA